MAGPRTRRSASREVPSSPPKSYQLRGPSQSQSPASRTKRATRSQSRDLGDGDAPDALRKSRRAQPNHDNGDVADSDGSLPSISNMTGKKLRRAQQTAELSMLTEVDEERDEDVHEVDSDILLTRQEGEDDEDENESDRSKDEEIELEREGEPSQDSDEVGATPSAVEEAHLQSLADTSGISGTTALMSNSTQELANLDTALIIDGLPDLWLQSNNILQLLTRSASVDHIEARVNELLQPGTLTGRRLRVFETALENAKQLYGSDEYINLNIISTKLFGTEKEIPIGHKPDTLFQAANVAVMVKSFFGMTRDMTQSTVVLQQLDTAFPFPFLKAFGDDFENGNSNLSRESYDLALALRTQTLIALLGSRKDDIDFNPDAVLVEIFYDPIGPAPSEDNDALSHGTLKRLSDLDVEGNDSASIELHERLQHIQTCFYGQTQSPQEGEHVDFVRLHQLFPWTSFLSEVVTWSRCRMAEITKVVTAHGGVNEMQNTLIEFTQLAGQDSAGDEHLSVEEVDLKSALLPAPNIMPATIGRDLYNEANSILLMQMSKRAKSASLMSSPRQGENAVAQGVEVSGLQGIVRPSQLSKMTLLEEPTSAQRSTTSARNQAVDDLLPRSSSDEEVEAVNVIDRPTAELVQHFDNSQRNANKENIQNGPSVGVFKKASIMDRQETAKRISFDSQNSDDRLTQNQVDNDVESRQYVQTVEDYESEDNGYEEDRRVADESRRAKAPVVSARAGVANSARASKRRRSDAQQEPPDEDGIPTRTAPSKRHLETDRGQRLRAERLRAEQDLQMSARGRDDESNGRDDVPMSTYAEVNETAKVSRARAVPSRLQTRQPWSSADCEFLIECIARYGCSWANIVKLEGDNFDRNVDQVGLKDKARNIKVDYLKCGADLPLNFDYVAIGQKERDKVAAVGMNPWRLEHEQAGFESKDMDGNIVGRR